MRLASFKRTVNSEIPVVMGVINLTPDSFWEGSRFSRQQLIDSVGTMLAQGAQIIDLGPMSTRPGSKEIGIQEEADRLLPALTALRIAFPDCFISVDTYRAAIAKEAAENDADMINDISGGSFDKDMFRVTGKYGLAYVLMHTTGKPETMQTNPQYKDVVTEVNTFFELQLKHARTNNIKTIVLDPGFGFGKTSFHNYRLLNHLSVFQGHGCPVMVGLSRKSMISKVLGTNAGEGLNGTTVLHTIALLHGANILRVHDVKEAMEVVRLVESLRESQ